MMRLPMLSKLMGVTVKVLVDQWNVWLAERPRG